MKILVAFYSRTGNTRKAGEAIARELKADVEEIIDSRNRQGIIGYLVSGMHAYRGKHTVIQETLKNPSGYDLVIVGTPIWADTVTPAIRTYLHDFKGKFRKVAFFCTMGGEYSSKAFAEMEAECGKKPVAVLALRAKEMGTAGYSEKIRSFVKKLGAK